MTFVSILMISIALLTIQVSRLYTRGTVMRDVNQAGVDVTRDMQQSIAQADDPGMIKHKEWTTPPPVSKVIAVCFGSTSYIMNDVRNTNPVKYGSLAPNSGQIVRIAKVPDTASSACGTASYAAAVTSKLNLATTRELLVTNSGRDLAIYSAVLPSGSPLKDDTGGALVMVSLTIGTSMASEVNLTDSTCRPPSDSASGAEYCSINQFLITGRVGNTYKPGGV